jgi:serine/threonine protein kinase
MSIATSTWDDDEAKKLPGYDLLDEFARDGLGIFFRARQRSLDRIITLYTILGGAMEDQQRQCLEREASILASLRHPNVVQILDRIEHNGQLFLVLEFVDGGSLDLRIRSRVQPSIASVGLVERLARTLAYIHERGVVHCDLKPRRILLAVPPVMEKVSDPDTAGYEEFFGIPKVAGFEVALRKSDLAELPEGTIRGTPAYMAPEQAQGRLHEIGPATDIHGLGAILYELLTGRPPYRGKSPTDVLKQVMESDPESPRKFNSHIDRKLEAICLKCLHKAMDLRYSNGLELASELRSYRDRRAKRRWFS